MMFWDGVCIGHPREQRGLHPSADARAVLAVVSTSCRATLPVVSTSAIASPIGRKIDISFKAGGTDYVDSGRIVCRFYVQWILKLSSDHLVQMFSIDLVDAVGDTIRCSFYLRRRGEVETMLPVAYSRHEWLQILHGMSTDERHAALKALKRTTLSVGTDNTSRGSGPFSVVSTSCRATWRTRIARTCAELLEYCTEVCGQGRGPIRSDSGAGRGIVMRLREHNAGPRDRDAVAVSNFFFDKLPNKLLARPHPPRSLLEDGDVEPNPGPKANDYCELAQLVAEEVEDYCQAVDEHGAKSSEMGWNADAPKSARRRQFGH